MLIKKVAQGCNFGNPAEISLITIKNTNQSKNLVLIDNSRSCTQHMGPSTRLQVLNLNTMYLYCCTYLHIEIWFDLCVQHI